MDREKSKESLKRTSTKNVLEQSDLKQNEVPKGETQPEPVVVIPKEEIIESETEESIGNSQILYIDELMKNLNGVKSLVKKTRNQELQTEVLVPEPIEEPINKPTLAEARSLVELITFPNNDVERDDSFSNYFIFDRNKRKEELKNLVRK